MWPTSHPAPSVRPKRRWPDRVKAERLGEPQTLRLTFRSPGTAVQGEVAPPHGPRRVVPRIERTAVVVVMDVGGSRVGGVDVVVGMTHIGAREVLHLVRRAH